VWNRIGFDAVLRCEIPATHWGAKFYAHYPSLATWAQLRTTIWAKEGYTRYATAIPNKRHSTNEDCSFSAEGAIQVSPTRRVGIGIRRYKGLKDRFNFNTPLIIQAAWNGRTNLEFELEISLALSLIGPVLQT